MVVGCPNCGRQHKVGPEMAGRRAKCSCGAVIQIPLATNPAQPASPVQPSRMTAQEPLFDQPFAVDSDPFGQQRPADPFQQPQMGSYPNQVPQPSGPGMSSEPVVCQFRYGKLQIWLLLCLVVAGISGVWMIYTGIFDNKGWAINNAPLPPWGATIFFECFGGLGFFAFCLFGGGYVFQLWHPRRVAMTQSSLIMPKGTFSTEELIVPFAHASYKVETQGSYSNLRIKHPGGTVRLMAILFPSSDEFGQFVSQLSQRAPTY